MTLMKINKIAASAYRDLIVYTRRNVAASQVTVGNLATRS